MARKGISLEQNRRASQLEHEARTAFEQGYGHRLKDEEWAKPRRRLLDYIETLARWDKEQRQSRKRGNRASEPEERKRAS